MPPLGNADQTRNSGTAVLSWTHTFGPTLLNEARTGYARNRNLHFPDLVGSDIVSRSAFKASAPPACTISRCSTLPVLLERTRTPTA